jgi:hypothetical protein
LAQEWITAKLNQANGVSVPTEIADIITTAETVLEACNLDEDSLQYHILTELLKAFNTGEFAGVQAESEFPPPCCSCKCP